MFGLNLLTLFYLVAVLAGFIAPYRYDNAATELPFHPPMITRIHVFDQAGSIHWPFVYGIIPEDVQLKTYRDDHAVRYPIRFFVRGDEYHILWVIRTNIHLFGVEEPGRIFLLGSNLTGQDVFSRILYGAQVSLSIGIVGIIISTLIGMLVGGIAGYFGGVVDFILMRAVEVLLAVPSLYFILILRQMFGTKQLSEHLCSAIQWMFGEGRVTSWFCEIVNSVFGGMSGSIQIYLIIVVVLAFIGWATEARVIRGMVLSLREQEYVVAARALGFSHARVIIRHILPNTFSFVIVTATLSVPFFILGEVALSFLGVGIQEPEASWGNMLTAAIGTRVLTDFPWILAPGVFIFLAVMAWNFLGDGLRDAADPRT